MKIYLLSSDGFRDSVNLKKYAIDEKSIKRFLIEENKVMDYTVIEESIFINFETEIISYKRHDEDGEIEDRIYYIYTLELI